MTETGTALQANNADLNGMQNNFFLRPLADADPELFAAIAGEVNRLQDKIELIASENIVSRAVLEAQGSVMTNKYAEGYPGRRYYGGCEWVDIAERLAVQRAKQLFDCGFANVQPHSGSQANQAVYLATMKPGDTLLGMSLAAGGHLSHGAAPNLSGKWLNPIRYGVCRQDATIDYDEVERLANDHKPTVIVCGGSAYPRTIDFERFRSIADSVDALLMVDMAHFAGLVAGAAHPSPFPHAHVATTTTHKTLRGPRGGLILTNDEALAKKIDSAIFPGLQGGPLEHVIAAKAVAFGEALDPDFKRYSAAVVENAAVLADTLADGDYDIVSGGTDTHLLLVDLRSKGLTGKVAQAALEAAGMTCNKNGVPFDTEKPKITSGIRLGSPAGTSRGFGVEEFRQIGQWIVRVLDQLSLDPANLEAIGPTAASVSNEVTALCRNFPIYPDQG